METPAPLLCAAASRVVRGHQGRNGATWGALAPLPDWIQPQPIPQDRRDSASRQQLLVGWARAPRGLREGLAEQRAGMLPWAPAAALR